MPVGTWVPRSPDGFTWKAAGAEFLTIAGAEVTVKASGTSLELDMFPCSLDEAYRRVKAQHGGQPVTPTPPAVTAKLCACGCGKPVSGARSDAQYATGACRVRAHRRKAAG